jgi:hypothetical protein
LSKIARSIEIEAISSSIRVDFQKFVYFIGIKRNLFLYSDAAGLKTRNSSKNFSCFRSVPSIPARSVLPYEKNRFPEVDTPGTRPIVKPPASLLLSNFTFQT